MDPVKYSPMKYTKIGDTLFFHKDDWDDCGHITIDPDKGMITALVIYCDPEQN